MSFPDVVTTFTATFAAEFYPLYPAAVVEFENNPPVDSGGNPTEKPTPDPLNPEETFYVRQTVTPAQTVAATLGGWDHTPGFTVYDVFVPELCGPAVGPEICEAIRGLFRRRTIGSVYMIGPLGEQPTWEPIGLDDNGRYRYSVLVPWQFTETGEPMPAILSNSIRVSQVAHGFAVGDAVVFRSTAWTKGQAVPAVSDDSEAIGVVAQVFDADSFQVAVGGALRLEGHGLGVGLRYLDKTTPGALTATPPSAGEVSWLVLVATSADDVVVFQREPLTL